MVKLTRDVNYIFLYKMKINTFNKIILTNDKLIRTALKDRLEEIHRNDPKLKIIEELGLKHGEARIDIAVVNGVLHGYEIKSDIDTLLRLPEQMSVYNSVFDKMTLVVGKNHLYEAFKMVPDWWGITIAKIDENNSMIFNCIREPKKNIEQDSVSMAKLLWRNEALEILKEISEDKGLRSKPREDIYQKLSIVFNQKTLGDKIRDKIFFRKDWRSDSPLMLDGGLYQQ